MRTSNMLATMTLAVATLGPGPAGAADDPDQVQILMSRSPEFAQGKKAADAKDWNTAIKWFVAADQRVPNNAEIHNLLGFSYRNAGQLEPAFKHYERALKLDPRHLGVHEYIGEAYLLAKNLPKAEEHLAALKRLCRAICEERDDLAKKIAEYKKGGGK
jgi:Flp pilus assembly protein TadD